MQGVVYMNVLFEHLEMCVCVCGGGGLTGGAGGGSCWGIISVVKGK